MQHQEIKLSKLDTDDVTTLIEAVKDYYNTQLLDYTKNKLQLSLLQTVYLKVQKLHFNFYKQQKFSLKLLYHYAVTTQQALTVFNTQTKDQFLKNRSLQLITKLDQQIKNNGSL